MNKLLFSLIVGKYDDEPYLSNSTLESRIVKTNYKEFYDTHYVHRIGVVVFVLNSNHEILFINEKKIYFDKFIHRWTLPGGIMEKGENLFLTAKREVKEETNAEIEPNGVLGVIDWKQTKSRFPDDPYAHMGLDIVVSADYITGDLTPRIEEGISDVKFMNKDEIEKLSLPTRSKEYLKRLFNKDILNLNYNKTNHNDCDWRFEYY